jgi:hypothetical protein
MVTLSPCLPSPSRSGPLFRLLQGKTDGLGFAGSLGLDVMVAVRLAGRQQAGEAAAALGKFFQMQAGGAEQVESAVHRAPIGAVWSDGRASGDPQLLR